MPGKAPTLDFGEPSLDEELDEEAWLVSLHVSLGSVAWGSEQPRKLLERHPEQPGVSSS